MLITAWGSIELAVEGMKARRRRLRHQAVDEPADAADGGDGARPGRARAAGGRAGADARRARRALRLRRTRRPRSADAAHAAAGRPRRADRGLGADHRRERHRQGAGRRGDPSQQPPRRQAVRQGEPRRHLVVAVRERDVRPRPRRLHRRARRTARAASSWPTAARSSSTRSAISIRRRRSRCCACCRTAPSRCSAPASGARSTCASSRRPTARSPEMVARGGFREDLLYRINLITIHLPPLRERPDDIPLLAARFLRTAAPGLSPRGAGATPRRDAVAAGAAVAGQHPPAPAVRRARGARQHARPARRRGLHRADRAAPPRAGAIRCRRSAR